MIVGASKDAPTICVLGSFIYDAAAIDQAIVRCDLMLEERVFDGERFARPKLPHSEGLAGALVEAQFVEREGDDDRLAAEVEAADGDIAVRRKR